MLVSSSCLSLGNLHRFCSALTMLIIILSVVFLILSLVRSDTCGQNRSVLGDWFVSHGSPQLLLDPIPQYVGPVVDNPYSSPDNPPYDPAVSGVCAMQWANETNRNGLLKYRLRNFENETYAEAANFSVSHQGHCGACSYLQDLGVYIRQNLTDATRECGILGSFSHSLMRNCLVKIGFSYPCITIWEWNIINTKSECFKVCVWSYITNEPNNKPDGSLNDCLQCDEDKSGPNFKFFSGRTRRNSGIISAIQRPNETIYKVEHCYWYGNLTTRGGIKRRN